MQNIVLPKAQEYNLKIDKIIDETYDTKTFRMKIPPGLGINFFPGQFFIVRFEDSKSLKRAYSISSSPTDREHLDITMNLVGEFTNRLWKCKINDGLIFAGPYGKFFFDQEMTQNLILICGGLGITPLRSIIRYCCSKNLPNKMNLIYSARTPEGIIYKEELEQFRKRNMKYQHVFTVTRPKPKHYWGGRTGRIDKELLRINIANIEDSLFFICGPLQFVKDVIGMLEDLGAKKLQIKTDIWGEE